MHSLERLRYPIGKFNKPENFTEKIINEYISDIEHFPTRLRKAVENLSEEQLNTLYRPDGWTIRQVVHHCADSHMNSIIRFKLALTEDTPIIKPYHEELWAELKDSSNMPIEPSLHILDGVHTRWVVLLRSLDNLQLKRTFIHPSSNRTVELQENIGIYAWHGNHHLAHITRLMDRMGW